MGRSRLVCVLGANGFIGRKTVDTLVEAGFTVRAVVRQAKKLPTELQGTHVEVVIADITDTEALGSALAGADVVVNCAGIYRWWVPDPEDYTRVNAIGAQNVARLCLESHSVQRLVHLSTPMAYGYPRDVPFREDSEPGTHASEYARTKHKGDIEVKKMTRGWTKFTAVMLYLGCVIGPGDSLSVGRPAAVCRDFIQGWIPMLVAPETRYVYVHIRDVQQAILAACTRDDAEVAGQDFFIGNSKETLTTREFFELLSRHTGRAAPTRSMNLRIAYWLAWLVTSLANLIGVEPFLPVDLIRTARRGSIEYDCSKSEARLGLKYTSIDVAVADAIEDVKQRLGRRSSEK